MASAARQSTIPSPGAPHASPGPAPRPTSPRRPRGASLATRSASPSERQRAASDGRRTGGGHGRKANVVTPGDFTGFGFDQCQAPSQAKMNRWLPSSPFLAVGIYIDGDSRACRNQTYLDATWVSTQLAKGWRLLPITLGPQASCQPRFPRYDDDFKISPKAERQRPRTRPRAAGPHQASESVAAADRTGHRPGQHALVRPRGLRPRQHQVPRVGAVVPQRRGPGRSARAGLRLRRLLQRRVGHQGARRRPGQPARRRSSCPTRSGSPAGTAWPTPARRTSATTAGCRTRGSSSTRAATTRPGAASRSTSTATTSTSAAARSAAPRGRTAAASPSRRYGSGAIRPPTAQGPAGRPGQGAAVPAPAAGRCTPAGIHGRSTRGRSPRPTPGRASTAAGAAALDRAATGCRC